MLTLADRTRNFWCAAMFIRRGREDRDKTIAIRVLEQVTWNATGTVQIRAATMLKEMEHGNDEHPTRAG